MAALDVSILLSLVDRASAPAAAALRRIRGGAGDVAAAGRAGAAATNALAIATRRVAAAAGAWVSIKGTVGAAMAFETALSEIEKVSGLSGEALKRQGERIRDLSRHIPVTATELAELTAASYQYGIAARDVERFTLLGAKAAIAFGMSAAEAGEDLAKIKAAFDLTIDDTETLADAINHVEDTTATKAPTIIDFLKRVGATSKQYRIAATDAAAFGGVMSSIGIESARGATAFNAVTAKLAGLTKNKDAVKALDRIGGRGYAANIQKKFFERPTEALIEFFKTARAMDRQSRAGFLIDFFGLEYQDDAAAISENLDKIIGKMEELDDAGAYVGSLDRIFKAFSATTQNRLKVLGNILTSWGIGLGETVIGPLNSFVGTLNDLFNSLDQRQTVFDNFAVSINGFFRGLGFEGAGSAVREFLAVMEKLLFGPAIGGREAGENLARLGEQARQAGAGIRSFIDTVGQLLGMDPGEAGGMVATMAGWGVKLVAAAIGFSVMAGAVRALTSAVLTLSGLRAAAGALAWLGRGAGALLGLGGAGGGVVAGAGAAAAGAGATGGGALAWLGRRAGSLARLGGTGAGAEAGVAGAGGGMLLFLAGLVKLVRAAKSYLPSDDEERDEYQARAKELRAEADKRRQESRLPEGAPPWVTFHLDSTAQDLENRVALYDDLATKIARKEQDQRDEARPPTEPAMAKGDRPDSGRDFDAVFSLFDGPIRTEPSGVQDVRLTNPPQPANVTVTVYAATGASPEAIGAAVAGEVAGALSRRGDADLRDAGGGW